ncbi:MAG: glycosyltransferase family A protein [Bauldia sp.]
MSLPAPSQSPRAAPTPIGSVSVVVEWENAGSILDETAVANVLNLAERIAEATDVIAGQPTLVMVSDPLVSSRGSYDTVLSRLRQRFANQMKIVAVDSPGGEYTDQKIAGTAASQSDIVVFADSDVVYRPGWLAQLLAPLHDPAVDYTHGRNVMMVDDIWGRAAAVYWFYPLEQEVPNGPTFVYFSNLAVRRSSYQRHPFPGAPGNRVACAMWCRALPESGLVGRPTMATGDHPPARGMAAVVKKGLDYSRIDDGRYVARNLSRPSRLFRATVRLLREIAHTLKRSIYVAVTLRRNPLEALQYVGIGLVYAVVTGIRQMALTLAPNPPTPKVSAAIGPPVAS